MKKKLLRYLWGTGLLSAVLLIAGLGVYQGVENIRQAEAQLMDVQQANHAMDKENRALYRTIQNLRQDRAAIERLCRNELGLVRNNEVIYKLPANAD